MDCGVTYQNFFSLNKSHALGMDKLLLFIIGTPRILLYTNTINMAAEDLLLC